MAATKRQIKRVDPESRPIDGLTGMVTLTNQNPAFEYKWVPEVGFFDVGYFESLGWQKCIKREGDVKPLRMGNTTEGGPISQLGQILMQREKAAVQEEYAAGQSDMDVVERAIFDQSFGRRLIRRYAAGGAIDAVNESGQGIG